MTVTHEQDGGRPRRIAELLHEYHHRQDALRRQASEVERLLGEVLAAADREAETIVGRARSEIRRTILEARRDVLALRAELDDMRTSAVFGADISDAQDRVTEKRRELREVLREASADLDALERHAAANRAALPPAAASKPPAEACAAEDARADVSAAASETPRRRSRLAPAALSIFPALAILVVLGTSWWLARAAAGPEPSRGASGAIANPKPAASAAPALPASRSARPILSSAAAAPRAAKGRPLSVQVVALRRVWVRATADGQAETGTTYAAGETRTFSADHDVSLRVGDAGAVTVAVNGGARETLGRDGEVATRHFSASAPGPQTSSSAIAAGATRASPAAALTVPRTPPATTPSTAVEGGGPSPGPVATAGNGTPGAGADARSELAARATRWFDAYYRADRSTLASAPLADATVSDERAPDERLPPGLAVRRSLEGLDFQFANDTAILSGRLVEQADMAGQPQRRASWISQMWTRKGGQWRLMDVRMVSQNRVQ